MKNESLIDRKNMLLTKTKHISLLEAIEKGAGCIQHIKERVTLNE